MTTLHLGVNDVPYDYKGSEGQSTGDVAETLEAKYSIMQTFFEVHGQEIADALAEAAVGSLENILMGAPVANHPFIAGETEIQRMFGQFLDLKEMDGRAAGVPTTYRCYDHLAHAFTAFTGVIPAADAACREIARLTRDCFTANKG